MDIQLVRRLPIYRMVLDGAAARDGLAGIAAQLGPVLAADFPHLLVDARRAQVLPEGAIGLVLAPVIRVLLQGGGAAILSPPPALAAAVEQLGLQTRVPVVKAEAQALEAILRMIPKRYTNAFFQLLLDDGVATQTQIKELHAEYKRNEGSIPFGTLLVRRGFLDIERLLVYLDRAENPTRYPPGWDADRSATVVAKPTRRENVTTMMGGRSEFFQKRLLGEILVESGIITEEQLRTVMDDPRFKSGEVKLGDALVQRGLVTPSQLYEALEVQMSRKGAPLPNAGVDARSEFVQRSLLGEILLERGLIAEKDLRLALDEQKNRPNSRIGDILIQLGVLGAPQLLEALEYQANRRG